MERANRLEGVNEAFMSVIRRACGNKKWCWLLVERVVELMGQDDVHGFPHVVRVLRNALEIAEACNEEIDMDVIVAAVLLHDVGRAYEEEKGIHHAVISADMAKPMLLDAGFPAEKIEYVIEAILSHSFSLGRKAMRIESMILSDADKLDAIGAVGVARAFMEGFRRGRGFKGTVEHFREKLLKLKDLMYTSEGRRKAEEKHKFTEEFLRKFLEESLLEKHF